MKRKIFILTVMFLSVYGVCFAQGEINRPKEKFEAQGLGDPFQEPFQEEPELEVKAPEKPVEPKKPLPALKVSGVIIGKVFNQAIINDKIVKVGDSIEGVTIAEINKEGIAVLFVDEVYNISSPAADIAQVKPENLKGGQQ